MAENGSEVLQRMVEAFAAGRGAEGEQLLVAALDAGLPWDQVASAAAIGFSRRFEESDASVEMA